MLIATVGILFGLGRLKAYRHQCELRFERQFELEKIMATRSAVNYLKTRVSSSGTNLYYETALGKQITAKIVPAERLYDLTFDRGWGDNSVIFPVADFCQPRIEEVQVDGTPDWVMSVTFTSNDVGRRAGFAVDFEDSWLSDPFGRRYVCGYMGLNSMGGGTETDIVRLYLVGAGMSLVGGEEDLANASVIVMEQSARTGGGGGAETIVNVYCRRAGDGTNRTVVVQDLAMNTKHAKGFLLSGLYVTLFEYQGYFRDSPWHPEQPEELPAWVAEDFDGDIRLYLEVESAIAQAGKNTFSDLYVEPAYRFQVVLGWTPIGKTDYIEELATVVQIMRYPPRSNFYRPITFDAHGAYDWQR